MERINRMEQAEGKLRGNCLKQNSLQREAVKFSSDRRNEVPAAGNNRRMSYENMLEAALNQKPHMVNIRRTL
ncbi:hypothetical protein ZHAS_00007737 [Anopheles sinensis]|uniref:Uncharacterized protein n=1 Tax=Anopheles sinensis TaxID=74873 RepID=A0A084VQW1_ANOSI|nr:hypothetical protein ZHAS_00007737 [Anopheles sinensis]